MTEITDYMKKNATYYLATVDEDGNPQVRPFGTFSEIDGAYYIQTGRKKDVYKQIEAHPRIAICDFDAEAGNWLRIEADAVDPHDDALEQKVLDEYPSLQKMYAAGDGNTAVLRLDNMTATLSSFTSEPCKLA